MKFIYEAAFTGLIICFCIANASGANIPPPDAHTISETQNSGYRTRVVGNIESPPTVVRPTEDKHLLERINMGANASTRKE